VLFGLRELQGQKYAYAVEGEQDVLTLRTIGLVATTSGNAGSWNEVHATQLQAAGVTKVVVLPDHDDAGRKHAETVARSCHAAGLQVKLVMLPGLPDKGDVSDWLAVGHTKDELVALVKNTPVHEPVATPVRTEQKRSDTSAAPVLLTEQPWPKPLAEAAYYGVIGEIVRRIEPQTEADPAAVLIQLLVMLGNECGRTPHVRAASDSHHLVLFAVIVGSTSKARKGVSKGQARRVFESVDPDWIRECVVSGLSSGEGVIWAVRDAIQKTEPIKDKGRVIDYQTVTVDAGIADKRLLIIEPEFASMLKVMRREGNTLSPVIRQAWDGDDLRTLVKHDPARATAPHISVIGQITRDELRHEWDITESGNGFGNRFLWACVRRSKELPHGGDPVCLDGCTNQLSQAVTHARQVGELGWEPAADRFWEQIYGRLSADRPGLLGSMTARAEAQVLRLAAVYAVADRSLVLALPHLRAALEVWRFCFDSAAYLFGDRLGDPTADQILRTLRKVSPSGLTKTDLLHDVFSRNRSATDIDRALAVLEKCRLARVEKDRSGGRRPAERWIAEPYDFNDVNDLNPASDPNNVVNVVGSSDASGSERDDAGVF
jgi:Protein of unknown function (DUF3987)/Toprim-like